MTALLACFTLAAVAAGFSAVRYVPAGQVYSLYRQGRPKRLLQAGTHLVLPLLDRIAHRIDLRGQTLRLEEARFGARGLSGTIYWQVLDPARADAVIEQVEEMIRRGTAEELGQSDTPQLEDRRELGGRLKIALNGLLRERGMMVTRVDLDLSS